MTLAKLSAAAPRIALVGLAKNTGKTVTMNALLGELAAAGEPVGVTSVGRDGEQLKVEIDARLAALAAENAARNGLAGRVDAVALDVSAAADAYAAVGVAAASSRTPPNTSCCRRSERPAPPIISPSRSTALFGAFRW